MAQQAPFRLLDLPRELRDHVYDQIATWHNSDKSSALRYDSRDGSRPVRLRHNVPSSISMTCRQVHHEYIDRALALSRLDLYTLDSFEGDEWLLLRREYCKPGILRILEKVGSCRLIVGIRELISRVGKDKVVDWMFGSSLAELRLQNLDDAKRTPSKAVIDRLRKAVHSILPHLAESASMVIEIDLTDLTTVYAACHEPHDHGETALWRAVGKPHTKDLEDRLATIVDIPALYQFRKDMTVTFPKNPIRIALMRRTPLWYLMASNSREILTNRKDRDNGFIEIILRPAAAKSNETVTWILASTGSGDWRDWPARFGGLSDTRDTAWW